MASSSELVPTADRPNVTLINVFSISTSDSERFLEHWRTSAALMSEQPGFVRTCMYCATAETAEFRYVNVAEWASIADFDRAQSNPRWRAIIQRFVTDPEIAVTSKPALYRPIIELCPVAGSLPGNEAAPQSRDMTDAVASSEERSYRFYRHRAHPEFRLVLRVGDPLPRATTADQWVMTRERAASDVSTDILEDIGRRGYAVFRLGVELSEIPVSETNGPDTTGL